MTKHRTRHLATIAIAAAIGVLLGTFARSSLRIGDKSDGPRSKPTASGVKLGSPEVEDGSKAVTAISAKLSPEEISTSEALELAPRSQRVLWFATQAETTGTEGMLRLMRLAGDDYVLRKMLAVRWARIDPQHMFETLAEQLKGDRDIYSMMRVLVEEWAKRDPDALIASLDDESAFPGIEGVRMTASHFLMKNDPEAGLSVLEKWGVRHYIPDMKKVTEWAKKNPRAAAERVLAIDADAAGIEALGAVGQAWAEVDPNAALNFAAGLSGNKGRKFSSRAMEVWAKADLEAAIAFASAQEDTTFRGLLGRGLLSEWAKHDVGAALQWGQEYLRSQLRAEAIGELVTTVTEKDPRAAAEIVAAMDPGGAQFTAVNELLRAWVKDKDIAGIREAVGWLDSLPDQDLAQRALEGVHWYFSWEHPEAVVAIVEGEHGHLASRRMINHAAETQVRKSPQVALEWAQNLPAGRASTAGSAVMRSWVQLQPDAAAEWALTLPGGEQRSGALDTVTRGFARRSVEGLVLWLDQLESGERTHAIGVAHDAPTTTAQKEKITAALADE